MVSFKELSLRISDDELEAFVSINATNQEFKPTLYTIKYFLKENGIKSGVDEKAINQLLENFYQGLPIQNVLVAQGKKAEFGKSSEIELKFEISTTPTQDEKGRINYREIGKVIQVKTDQLLAVKNKMKAPVFGVTVTGKITALPEVKDFPLVAGKNIRKEIVDEIIYFRSDVDGALKYENNTLSVHPTLEVENDVDFNQGNIHYAGDVKVGRDVLPDFIIEAEGQITIHGSAIACQLKSMESIDVGAGIVGKNKGHVYAEKNISCTFIENADIRCKGDLSIKNGVIGSNIHCDGFVSIQLARSRIVGSVIKACKGVNAFSIGSRFDTNTQIITGVDPVREIEFLEVKRILDIKLEEAKQIEKRYGRPFLENKNFAQGIANSVKIDVEKWELLKDEIQNINQLLKEAENSIYDYKASIKVRETIFPRVYIQIGKFKMTTSKEYHNVNIRYSKEEGKFLWH